MRSPAVPGASANGVIRVTCAGPFPLSPGEAKGHHDVPEVAGTGPAPVVTRVTIHQ